MGLGGRKRERPSEAPADAAAAPPPPPPPPLRCCHPSAGLAAASGAAAPHRPCLAPGRQRGRREEEEQQQQQQQGAPKGAPQEDPRGRQQRQRQRQRDQDQHRHQDQGRPLQVGEMMLWGWGAGNEGGKCSVRHEVGTVTKRPSPHPTRRHAWIQTDTKRHSIDRGERKPEEAACSVWRRTARQTYRALPPPLWDGAWSWSSAWAWGSTPRRQRASSPRVLFSRDVGWGLGGGLCMYVCPVWCGRGCG
jgi:hypothetical protein